MNQNIEVFFSEKITLKNNVWVLSDTQKDQNHQQTNEVFSDKWSRFEKEDSGNNNKLFLFQKKWYLDLYGFKDESDLKRFLNNKKVILDAGCGLGYKSSWFAELSPNSLIIAMDYSDSVFFAQKQYKHLSNLFFVKGNIEKTKIKDNTVDYISCDQVIHHTENPDRTMLEFSRILKKAGQLAVYVYAKKALPRELLDDYFRDMTKSIPKTKMWELSNQLTQLGKTLSDLNISIDVPEIPLLGIKKERIDIQRFIYWNFLKCFWNPDLGLETSISTNYDWYAPSNAKRYSKKEFEKMIQHAKLKNIYLHSEEACFSGRFSR